MVDDTGSLAEPSRRVWGWLALAVGAVYAGGLLIQGQTWAGAAVLALVALAAGIRWFAPSAFSPGDSNPVFRAVWSSVVGVALVAFSVYCVTNDLADEGAHYMAKFGGWLFFPGSLLLFYAAWFWARRARVERRTAR